MHERRLPGGPPPAGNNLFGSLAYLYSLRKDVIGVVGSRFAAFGDVYCVKVAGRYTFVIRHPEHIAEVLLEKADVFRKPESGINAGQLRKYLGLGLLNSNGELWRRQRRMIQPAFGRRDLERYAATMVEYAADMAAGWHDGQRIDVSTAMMTLTLRVVGKVLFGEEVGGDVDSVARVMDTLRRSFSSAGIVLPRWIPSLSRSRAEKAQRELNAIIAHLIEVKRREPEATDLLGRLVAAVDEDDHEGMSSQQLRDEVVTLYLAGHETTSHALSWTWYLLAKHPEVEARLHRELDDVLGGRLPTLADLEALPYATAALSESMRVYPPAYVIPREAAEDCTLAGFDVPRDSHVVVWIYHTHHDPRWFPRPEVFEPERFLGGTDSLPACAYLPFGAGTRTCIGKRFALMEATLILATIAQRYRLGLDAGTVVDRDPSVTLRPRGGLPMTARAC